MDTFHAVRSVLFIVDFEQISQILLLFLLLNLKNQMPAGI